MPTCVLLRTIFAGTALLLSAASAFPQETVSQMTSNGAWCWFSSSTALYDNGDIIASWVTNSGSLQVGSYQVGSGQTSVATLLSGTAPDDHNYPAFYKTSDGRLTAFFDLSDDTVDPYVRYRTTVAPGDISAWTAMASINTNTSGSWPFSTYVNPYQVPGSDPNQALLFWRGGNLNPSYSTGTYNSTTTSWTWSSAQTFISNPGQRPYVKYCEDGSHSRIGVLFTDGNPAETTNNVYFAYVAKDGSGNLAYYQPNGTKIQNLSAGPITPSQAIQTSAVFNKNASGGATDNAWVWDTAFDKTGNPVVVYTVFPDDNRALHQYWWGRWNGSAWDKHLLVADSGGSIEAGGATGSEPYYSGGITLDDADPSTVYLSCKNSLGGWDLEQWKTTDLGATWTDIDITSGSTLKNVRPIVPLNHPANTDMVLWMSGSYNDYDGNFNTAIDVWTVPEPSVLALLATGVLGLLVYAWRKRK